MQGAFIQSLTFNPPTVLGRKLMPFSSWHLLVLEAAGSPFVLGGVPDIDDLVAAIWVCSHGFAEGITIAGDAPAIRKWARAQKKPAFTAARAAFQDYVNAAFCSPEYWSSSDGGEIRAPACWHMATFAMRELHMTEQAAWDFPVNRIGCYQACAGESNGNKDLMSADDIKGVATLEADADKEKAEKEKK
ncbi:MAG: hypothetical protein L6455_14630 [Kiritimatiellae bacterium]|nr:hypothetical protein [Kiritimatiellia bacterium]